MKNCLLEVDCLLSNERFLNITDYLPSNERTFVDYELGKTWKDAVMAYCNVLSYHLSGGVE